MEGSLLFLERHGFDDFRDILKAARLGPYTSVADFAALPDSVIYSSGKSEVTQAFISARSLAREACNHCLDFRGERRGFFTRHVPGAVGGGHPRPGNDLLGVHLLDSPKINDRERPQPSGAHRLRPRSVRVGRRGFLQVGIRRGVTAVAGSIAHSHMRPDGLRAYTFADRCRASGCRSFIPRVSFDGGVTARESRDGLQPTKRMRLERDELNSRTPNLDAPDKSEARLPQNLALEASFRAQFAQEVMDDLSGGDRLVRSVHGRLAPQRPALPRLPCRLQALGEPFRQRRHPPEFVLASHFNFAHRILSLLEMRDQDIINSIIRGSKK